MIELQQTTNWIVQWALRQWSMLVEGWRFVDVGISDSNSDSNPSTYGSESECATHYTTAPQNITKHRPIANFVRFKCNLIECLAKTCVSLGRVAISQPCDTLSDCISHLQIDTAVMLVFKLSALIASVEWMNWNRCEMRKYVSIIRNIFTVVFKAYTRTTLPLQVVVPRNVSDTASSDFMALYKWFYFKA